MIPGEVRISAAAALELNAGRETVRIMVINRGDRPVQVGSHFHFYEVNQALDFERPLAFGKRLDIASGLTVRFEPGEEKPVTLTAFGGARKAFGANGLTQGPTNPPLPWDILQEKIRVWKGDSIDG